MMLKHLFLLAIMAISALPLAAQRIAIKGRVLNAESKNAVEFANVALLQAADSSLVTGNVSDIHGRFSLSAISGKYILQVGYIGFESHRQYLEIEGKSNVNLGNIFLSADTQSLDEVVVEGASMLFESDIDKRVYNVENSILAQGGTARDILETLPSIQMDEEGNISMRGSGNILIYINGRPTNLTSDDMESILEQFPASAIQSIELITNPSSRYDAAGVGGIINLILKKELKLGFNGQLTGAIGTQHKYNGGFSMNYGSGKWNTYASYNYQYQQLWEQTLSFRNMKTGNVSPFMNQDYYNTNYNQSHLMRLGTDYNLNENTTLGLYLQGNYRKRDRNRRYEQRFLNILSQPDSSSVRLLSEDQYSINMESGITIDHNFSNSKSRLHGSFSHAYNFQERIEYFDQRYFGPEGIEQEGLRDDQIYGRPQNDHLFIFQMDYERPLREHGKIELGIKSTLSRFDHGQEFDERNRVTGEFVRNDTIAGRFLFDEFVHAAYGIYRDKMGKLSYQAGLRAELTLTESFNFNPGETVVNNYFNLFPSLFLSYDLGNENELQLNYSRRISRPGVGILAPFYNVQDFLNLRMGNPFLQPEFTNSYEFGYLQQMDKMFFTGTLYYRHSSDVITRIFSVIDANNAIVTWKNANIRRATGLELIHQYSPVNWFDVTLSGNFFHSEIIGQNIGEGLNNSNFSWTVSMLSSISILSLAQVQIQGSYRGPMVLPQGLIDPIWGLNVGIRKDILNRKATVALNVSDVFNTRIFKLETEDNVFYQLREFDRETRIGTLSIIYRFGGFREKTNGKKVPKDDLGSDPF